MTETETADGGAPVTVVSQTPNEPAVDVFRVTYRLIEDLQRVRLSHDNRIRQALPLIPDHVKPPKGYGSWADFFKISAETLKNEEGRVLKLAERLLKDDEITGKWLLAQRAMGPSLAVSILGECVPLSRFKSPRSLWAYAGLHVLPDGTAPRRRKGQKANWNGRLKTRLYLFSVSCLKLGGPYRKVYDDRKVLELTKLGALSESDSQENAAPEGDDVAAHGSPDSLSASEHDVVAQDALNGHDGDAHDVDEAGALSNDDSPTLSAPGKKVSKKLLAHNRSLRYVQKMLLKDLWRVAHGEPPLVGYPLS